MNGLGMSCFHLTDLLHACPNKSQIPRAVIHNDISGQIFHDRCRQGSLVLLLISVPSDCRAEGLNKPTAAKPHAALHAVIVTHVAFRDRFRS